MIIQIDQEILQDYPDAAIGYLVAEVTVQKSDPFVESLKRSLEQHLKEQGLDATQFVTHPSLSIWRKIYEEKFHVKAKTFRSSLEALVRRVLTGKSVWEICNVVDLYNCCSVLSLLPMGGYDLAKVSGDIHIRYARQGETFLGLGERKPLAMHPDHVVYADDNCVMCWLWNHKDAEDTCIDAESKRVIFFIDSFDREKAETALQLLAENLKKIHCTPLEMGVLEKKAPQAAIAAMLKS